MLGHMLSHMLSHILGHMFGRCFIAQRALILYDELIKWITLRSRDDDRTLLV